MQSSRMPKQSRSPRSSRINIGKSKFFFRFTTSTRNRQGNESGAVTVGDLHTSDEKADRRKRSPMWMLQAVAGKVVMRSFQSIEAEAEHRLLPAISGGYLPFRPAQLETADSHPEGCEHGLICTLREFASDAAEV